MNYYSVVSNIHIYYYTGNNIDLVSACGKYYKVTILGILYPADSGILILFEKNKFNKRKIFNF